MLYFISNGHELIKANETTGDTINLHTKESNQVTYRAMYIINEDGTILYKDKVTNDAQKLKVKTGDVVIFIDEGTPTIVKDKAFNMLVQMYFDDLKNKPNENK